MRFPCQPCEHSYCDAQHDRCESVNPDPGEPRIIRDNLYCRMIAPVPPPTSDKRSWDITQIVTAVHDFEQRFNSVKNSCSLPAGRDWYPYHTFSSIDMLESMLTGDHRKLLSLTEGYPVLDIG